MFDILVHFGSEIGGGQAALLAVQGEREFLGIGRQENLYRDEVVGGREIPCAAR